MDVKVRNAKLLNRRLPATGVQNHRVRLGAMWKRDDARQERREMVSVKSVVASFQREYHCTGLKKAFPSFFQAFDNFQIFGSQSKLKEFLFGSLAGLMYVGMTLLSSRSLGTCRGKLAHLR